jgi:hypothetical protein
MAEIRIIVLALHNLLRWLVLGFALYALYRQAAGLLNKQSWSAADRKSSTFYVVALDLQLLVGLILYFVLSDLVRVAFSDPATAMSNPTLRFFLIEHFLMMVLAVVFAHLASAAGKKELPAEKKFQRVLIFTVISLILLLAGIPWSSRPLLPIL